MAVSEELEVLKDVVGRLERAGIAYMITGSTAANFYAVPRMTRDIDIVIEKDSGSEVQLLDVRNLLNAVKRLNRSYLTHWVKRLGVGALYRKVAK